MATIQGQEGVQTLSAGVAPATPARITRSGELGTSDVHARYQEAVSKGNVFNSANTAVQALSVNSATATGLVLSNPLGSGKNIVLLEVCISAASLPAGQSSFVLTANNNPAAAAVVHTTPITPKNALLGGATGVGLTDSAATLPAAPTVVRAIGGGPAATIAASTSWPAMIKDEVAGAIILAPGTAISLQALTTAISAVASFTWEEVPA